MTTQRKSSCSKKTSQIKSKKRVREKGEVFTNPREVRAMCNLIPKETWNNIESTFLEPSCGNGNFLVEILRRKLKLCNSEKDGLKALNSIVAIDIMSDNCNEARERLRKIFYKKFPNANDFVKQWVEYILQNNIICGDSLKIMKEWEEKNNVL